MTSADDIQKQHDVLIPEKDERTQEEIGEESALGSSPVPTSDDDTGEVLEGVIGNEPEPGKPFTIAKEVEKDEKARRDVPKGLDEEGK